MSRFFLVLFLGVVGCTPHDFSSCVPRELRSVEAFCYNTRYQSWMSVFCDKLPKTLQREASCPSTSPCPVAWGLECHAKPYRDGQLWYFNCVEGSRHAETVDAVDLHDGDGFMPWCQ